MPLSLLMLVILDFTSQYYMFPKFILISIYYSLYTMVILGLFNDLYKGKKNNMNFCYKDYISYDSSHFNRYICTYNRPNSDDSIGASHAMINVVSICY